MRASRPLQRESWRATSLLWRVALSCAVALLSSCQRSRGAESRLTLSGAWALYPMAVAWAERYQQAHPGITIDVSAGGAGKGMADVLSGAVDLGMVSRSIHPAELAKGAWPIAVVKDAVVATIQADSPVRDALLVRGLSQKELTQIWVDGTLTSWSFAQPGAQAALHAYTRSDACGAADTWAQYLGTTQESLRGIAVYGDPGVAAAVRADPLGIGYNNVNYAYDLKTKKAVEGIRVVPLDRNGNQRIDPEEQFYDTLDALTAAIADGRYPSPPARELYFVSKGSPGSALARDFLRWVLTEGQAQVVTSGYVPLSPPQLAAELGRLPSTER
jgi:phosphate transport system substrate-binding protein